MFFDFLSIIGLIAFIVLAYLFFQEKRKIKERFSESQKDLTDNVKHINDVVDKNQSELDSKLSEQYLETIEMFQEERGIVQANKEMLEKKISESDEKFTTIAEHHREKIESKITDDYKFLTDQLRTLATATAKLRADSEDLKKQIAFFTEIGADSTQLNEDVDFELEDLNIDKAVSEAREIIKKLDRGDQTFLEEGETAPEFDIKAILDYGVEIIPDSTILDLDQLNAVSLMENTNENLFITGKAGTGKSFLLKVFVKLTKKKTLKVSPTGIAALNIGGATIHSTFGFNNLVYLNVEDIDWESISLNGGKIQLLREMDTLIIDEISMVRADTFHKIDRILRVVNNKDIPFGGKQIIAFGDLFQLPPIASKEEENHLKIKYKGIHFFNSDAYKEGKFRIIELDSNHRQKQDATFFEILNRMREGNVSEADISVINKQKDNSSEKLRTIIRLFPTKAEAEKVNQKELEKIPPMYKEHTYHAKILYHKYNDQNKIKTSDFPIEPTLKLKVGALVMMVKNDLNRHWVNGTLGIVSFLSDDKVKVTIDKIEYEVEKQVFESREASLVGGRIEYEIILKVEQYPIVLGYAITIHKSQGQTYQKIACDITDCFAPGQAYVALSRCSTLDGLHLLKEIDGRHIAVDSEVRNFYVNAR
jgi:DNA replication protein DnaC